GVDRLGDDDPRNEKRDADADDRRDRHRGVLEGVADQHLPGREALSLRCSDVVLREDVEHRGAGDPSDERGIETAERDRRQDEVPDERAEPVPNAGIALYWQEVEPDREAEDEDIGKNE